MTKGTLSVRSWIYIAERLYVSTSKCPRENCAPAKIGREIWCYLWPFLRIQNELLRPRGGEESCTAAIGGRPRPLVDAHPAVRREPLLRQEAALVVHLVRAAHPIAEIDVGKPHLLRPDDMIEDHERAQRPRRFLWIEERIDHRQTVAEHVGQRDGKEVAAAAHARAAVGWRQCARRLAPPVFDDAGLDMAVLDHHGVVQHRHVGHAAVAMARIEIGAED